MRGVLTGLLGVGLVSAAGHFDIPVWARGGQLYKDHLAAEADTPHLGNSTANFFTQLIDHNNPASGTFPQRYYVDFSYWNGTSFPVFLYIGGEGVLSGTPRGYAATIAQELGALIVALEHRWYGASVPGDITSTSQLQTTLTVEQAIADLASFQSWMMAQLRTTGPWLAVGGSYPGALAAWYREAHPELVSAAWSSSGVVNAVYNYTDFDAQLAVSVGPSCAAGIRAVTAAFEAAWDDDAKRASMIALFRSSPEFTKGDFAWMLADSAAMGPQYGKKLAMCAYLDPLPADPLAAFANWTLANYGPAFGSSCYYSTACLSNASRVAEWYNVKPWIWQCCSEVAYWQVAYPGSLRSAAIDLAYFGTQCQAAFGVPMLSSTDAINARYGGATPRTSRVYASDGSDDPWQGATVRAPLGPDYPMSTAQCDGCSHCKDLGAPSAADSNATVAQRLDIRAHVAAWLAPSAASRGGGSGRRLSAHAADALMGVGLILALAGLGVGAVGVRQLVSGARSRAGYKAVLLGEGAPAAAATAVPIPTGKGPKGPPTALSGWQWLGLGAAGLVPGVVLLSVGAVV